MFCALSLLSIGLAIPFILKKVPPNEVYGFRTARSLANEKVWYAANYFSGWTLLIAGIVSLLAIIILHFNPQWVPEARYYGFVVTALYLAPLIIAVILSFVYSTRL
jgi:uncharacterized membrane protein